MRGWFAIGLVFGTGLVVALPVLAQQRGADRVLAVVNGQPIRQSQIARMFQIRRVPETLQAQTQPLFLEELIDAAVMRKYLADRDALPSPAEVDAAVDTLKQVAARGGRDPDEALRTAGFTPADLREEVALPLAWQKHVQRVVTRDSLKAYFEKHRAEFDGTKIHARHIFLKVGTEQASPELTQAESLLKSLRAKIVAGEISFEEAAQTYSHGPSASRGGDIGVFPWHGKMPEAFSQVAFRLKVGEVSEPFRTPFGVHLCTVLERTPGEFSLEDARDSVLAKLSQDLWKKTAAEQRAKAKVERSVEGT